MTTDDPRRHRHPLRRRPAPLLALFVALGAVGLAGCWSGPGVEQVRRGVERELPGARFDQEVHVRLGRMSTGVARWVAGLALDEDDPDQARAGQIVAGLHRVEVAVYTARDLPELDQMTIPAPIDRMLGRGGWQVMVAAQSPGERAWVLTRSDRATIRSLYLVALSPDELAIVRLEGHLDQALAAALAERPGEAPERILDGA